MKTDKYRIRIYLAVFMFLLLVAISGFMYFEKMSLIDAVYFSIVTMATVGYGDIHPQTEVGKILAILIIIGKLMERPTARCRHPKLQMHSTIMNSEILCR